MGHTTLHTNGPHNTAHQWATQHCTPMDHTTMHINGPHNTAQKGKDRATRISLQLGVGVSKNQIDIYLQFSIYSDIFNNLHLITKCFNKEHLSFMYIFDNYHIIPKRNSIFSDMTVD
jgi:hypothetical protein